MTGDDACVLLADYITQLSEARARILDLEGECDQYREILIVSIDELVRLVARVERQQRMIIILHQALHVQQERAA